MKQFLSCLAGLCAAAALAASAVASPIVYNAQLVPGVTVTGTTNQGAGQQSNPVGAQYYSFFAVNGATVSITGLRLDGPFDMSFWVLSGLFADTNDFGASFDAGDAAYTAFADDQLAPNIPGPFGDPFLSFVAPLTGFYTIAVTNFLSSANPPFDFQLTATGVVPEPGTLALLGLGLAALGLRRRNA